MIKIKSMKRTALLFSLLFLIFQSHAQYQSERSFDTFEKVVIRDGIKVKFFQSEQHKVILQVSDMPETKVLTTLSAYELTIKLETGIYEKGQVYAEVYAKRFKSLKLRDNSSAEVDKVLKGDDLKIGISSSSKAKLNLEYNYLEIEASTKGDLELIGSAKVVKVSENTQARVNAYELLTENVEVRLNTQAEFFIKTENSLDAQVSTGAKVYYKGDPAKLREKASLGGEIINSN
jgi:hypothetical protein